MEYTRLWIQQIYLVIICKNVNSRTEWSRKGDVNGVPEAIVNVNTRAPLRYVLVTIFHGSTFFSFYVIFDVYEVYKIVDITS